MKKKEKWQLVGLDNFEGEYYPLRETYNSREDAEIAAGLRQADLDRTQRNSQLQDSIFIQECEGGPGQIPKRDRYSGPPLYKQTDLFYAIKSPEGEYTSFFPGTAIEEINIRLLKGWEVVPVRLVEIREDQIVKK